MKTQARVSGDWLTSPTSQHVLGLLTDGGHQAFFVGGCVRNALLDVAVSDLDIATDAPPEIVTELAEKAKLHVVPTGIEHGTVTVVADKIPFEVTTFRRDIATDGRRATVAYTTDVTEDARRRDFTMNALYADARGVIIDPVGGLADLQRRQVRFIGSASERLAEDYLRSLRFFRFHAWYGDAAGGIDPDGLDAVARGLEGLRHVSAERIGAEVLKLLAARDPAPAVAAMEQTGLLARVLPGASALSLPLLVDFEGALPPDALRRLATLGPADIASGLRLSRADKRRLGALAGAARSDTSVEETGYRLGATDGLSALLIRHALAAQPPGPNLAQQVRHASEQIFPVAARDLSDKLRGPDLGAALKTLEARWIASGFTLSRTDLLS